MPTAWADFKNSEIADAVQKAARIAPSKGEAFDKAQGILIEVNTAQRIATVRSTNLNTHFIQQISVIAGEGADVMRWRVPSSLFSTFMGSLPKGENDVIRFYDQQDHALRVKSGRLFASYDMLGTVDYPAFPAFTSQPLSEATSLAGLVSRVAWATDKSSPILSGIHIDGTNIVGCGPQSMVMLPCPAPVAEPITVPMFLIAPALKEGKDVRIGSDGSKLYIAVDDHTHVVVNLIDGNFPNYLGLVRNNFLLEMQVSRVSITETLDSLLALVKAERLPTLQMTLDTSSLLPTVTFDLNVQGVGRMQNSFDVETDYTGDPFTIYFTPGNLAPVLKNATGTKITLRMGHDTDAKKSALLPVQVMDESGFLAMVMPRKA